MISGTAVTDFDVPDVLRSLILEMMSIATASLEACTHAGLELGWPHIGYERRKAFQYVDKLVLLAVPMTDRRDCAWFEAREVHAEVPVTRR